MISTLTLVALAATAVLTLLVWIELRRIVRLIADDEPATGHAAHALAAPAELTEVLAAPARTDYLIEGPARVVVGTGADSVKDWLQHYTYDRHTWADAVAEFYRRAAADPEVADYFRGVDLERLQRHFTAAMIFLTGRGLRQSTVERIRTAHASIRNSRGEPITGPIYDRVIGVLVGILQEWNVPASAIADLARIIGPLRAAVVVAPNTGAVRR